MIELFPSIGDIRWSFLTVRLLRYDFFVHYNDFDLFFVIGFDIIICLFYGDLQDRNPLWI
jgi:hypothetical protein